MTDELPPDPTLVPEFYEEQDGWYRYQLKRLTAPVARVILPDDPPDVMRFDIEPLDPPRPRMTTKMRWVEGWWG